MVELTAFDLPLGPAPAAEYQSGQVLADRYELTRVIGHGGTADVWIARDAVLDIDVAAKIVLPARDDPSSGLRERTIQEARLCAQLTEPAVCRVLDFGFTPRGDPFVVSELLSGETLEDRMLREGRIPAIDAVRLLLPILDALEAAHKRGIVHRDVKPANVFLACADGRTQPKLLDFGIACSPDVVSRMTAVGTICGTPCYMSPEQARGNADIDPRSDLWSFCVTLYEAISGTAPFLHDNFNATLFAITNQTAPSLQSLGCDGVLARIVERGMQKERESRWPSAAELADALARWLVDHGFESDVAGIAVRRRFLQRSRSSVPPLLDVAEEATTERAFTFVPERRQRWAGAVALVSTLAAVGVVTLVAVSARRSVPTGRIDSQPVSAAPVVPPPAPPLPIFEGVATSAPAPPLAREAPTRDASSTVSASVPKSPAHPPPRRAARPTAEELLPFPTDSPFAPARPGPSSVDPKLPWNAASPAKPPARPRSRTRGAPRDYGI